MSNRRNAALHELDRVIIALQKEYDLTPIELISLLSSKTAEISEGLMTETNTRKVPVKKESIENTIMRQVVELEKLGMK